MGARVSVVSKVFSMVSEDKSGVDVEAVRGYNKMRRRGNVN